MRPGGGDNVTPQIHQGSCSGTDITGTTQSVVIGQQIALCATYNLPSGVSVTQQSWYPDSGSTIVGGYSPPHSQPHHYNLANQCPVDYILLGDAWNFGPIV